MKEVWSDMIKLEELWFSTAFPNLWARNATI